MLSTPWERLALECTLNNVLFTGSVAFQRLSIQFKREKHPTSDPFISGDSFRSLCLHHYEEENTGIDASNVHQNDIVFVKLSMLKVFFQKVHPYIKSRYILVSHNGDEGIHKHYLQNIDSKIIVWYSQNVLVKHSKLVPIPIGLENLSYSNHGRVSLFQKKVPSKEKKSRILYGFSISTNPKERLKAQEVLESIPLADQIQRRLISPNYIRQLREYEFVASPRGHGEDCIRTWEALYVDTIPIVQRSVAMEYFESLGLPIWIVDSWDELTRYSQLDLHKKYKMMIKKRLSDPLFFPYWKDRIFKKEAYGK